MIERLIIIHIQHQNPCDTFVASQNLHNKMESLDFQFVSALYAFRSDKEANYNEMNNTQ